ncbi:MULTISPECIES: hypothetical protein [Mycobacteriaceae]|uniref:hypothetical protein n=1 Tax=Mycobacteriaceae TaxID=1762 RepID=UPI0006530901|nr:MULTISPECIES: hypothetical protein [Mycobacteriaceae]QSM56216.1 hypothetical protein IN840_25620 [Mycobacteroides abscessus subsp. abscessus]
MRRYLRGAAEVGGSLPLRKRRQNVALNIYVRPRPGTQQRIEVLKDRGYAVTDIVDAALNEFLDRAGRAAVLIALHSPK